MGISSLINRNDMAGGNTPVQFAPASFNDVLTSTIDNFLKNETSVSSRVLQNRQIQKQYEAIQNEEGISLENIIGPSAYEDDERRFEETDAFIRRRREEGVEEYQNILTTAEMRDAAEKNAKQAQIDNFRTRQAAKTEFGKQVGTIIGALAGSIADPVTIASVGVGAGYATAGKSLLKIAAIEGAIGVGSEALIQPAVVDWQKQVGNPYTFDDAMANIAFAGLASAGLGAMVNVPFRKAFKASRNQSALMFDAAANSPKTPAALKGDLNDFANYIRVKEDIPFTKTAASEKLHMANSRSMDDALVSGNKARDANVKLTDDASAGLKRGADELPDTPYGKPEEEFTAKELKTSQSYEVLDNATVERVRAVEAESFQRLANENPDLTIRLDDGSETTLKDMSQQVSQNNELLNVMRVCAS